MSLNLREWVRRLKLMKTTFSKLVEKSKSSLETIDSHALKDMIESKEEGIDILNMLVRDGKITHVKNEHEFKDEYLFYVFS